MTFKENARPIAMCFLVLGLIIGAILETLGYSVVEWFRTFAIAIVGEWFVERGVRKSIGKE